MRDVQRINDNFVSQSCVSELMFWSSTVKCAGQQRKVNAVSWKIYTLPIMKNSEIILPFKELRLH